MKCSSKQHKQKVLITGGTGFIGSRLRILLEEDASTEVISVDSRPSSDGGLVLNLACRESVQTAVSDGGFPERINCVVHLAARLVSADNSKDTSILLDNIKMAENVVYLAEALGAEKVIHASSMAVYPNRTGVYSEESITNSVQSAEGLYGLSKICGEQLIDFLLKGTCIKTVHMRLAQVYGDGMRNDRVISMMKQELSDANRITVYGNGERESNFISIAEVVRAISFFIRNEADGVYNIGGRQLSYMQLAQSLIRECGNTDSTITTVPRGCREKVVLDCSKYEKINPKDQERL